MVTNSTPLGNETRLGIWDCVKVCALQRPGPWGTRRIKREEGLKLFTGKLLYNYGVYNGHILAIQGAKRGTETPMNLPLGVLFTAPTGYLLELRGAGGAEARGQAPAGLRAHPLVGRCRLSLAARSDLVAAVWLQPPGPMRDAYTVDDALC